MARAVVVAGAGAIGFLCAVEAVAAGTLLGTAGLEDPDPDCALPLIAGRALQARAMPHTGEPVRLSAVKATRRQPPPHPLSALLTACQVGFWSRGVGSGKYAVTRMLTVLPVPGAP